MAYKDLHLENITGYVDFAEVDYNTMIERGFTHEEIADLFRDNNVYVAGQSAQIQTFLDARKAFMNNNPCKLILYHFAFHLLGGHEGDPINGDEVDELARDLEPLFDKWVK